MDFDTGNPTGPGEYRLTDETYAKLLDKLAKEKFGGMLPDLRAEHTGLLPEPFGAQLHQEEAGQVEQSTSRSWQR